MNLKNKNPKNYSKKLENMKVALVHDFLTTDGGAERVLRVLHELFPLSKVFTPVYFKDRFDPPLKGWDIETSFVSKLPFQKLFKHQYKLFYQLAMEQFNFDDFDLVISNTFAGYAKGVITTPGTKHFSFVHNVPRYLWGLETALHGSLHPIYENLILPPLEHWWRIWDRQAADRPDFLMANSVNVQRRITKFYRRKSHVLYPPVEVEEFLQNGIKHDDRDDYFVYFGRLEKYKRIDMAIKACVKADKKLKIIGGGSAEDSLRDLVNELSGGDLIKFLGRVSDKELKEVVAKAQAFIFPCPDEDFGIVPVESMALGTPVIAFDSGGVAESVIDGETGVLIEDFSQQSLTSTIKDYDISSYEFKDCQKRARDFDKEHFKANLFSFISDNL